MVAPIIIITVRCCQAAVAKIKPQPPIIQEIKSLVDMTNWTGVIWLPAGKCAFVTLYACLLPKKNMNTDIELICNFLIFLQNVFNSYLSVPEHIRDFHEIPNKLKYSKLRFSYDQSTKYPKIFGWLTDPGIFSGEVSK